MRNNQDQIGLDPLSTVQEPVEQVKGLSYPNEVGEMVDLPTSGKFYPKDHPLKDVSSVEIREVTTEQLQILQSKTLLQKGLAMDKMLQSLLIDKKIKVNEMFIGDKNKLALAARIVGFTSEYKTKVICPSCGEKVSHVFDLNKIEKKEEAKDVKISPDGTFPLELPKTKVKVVCRMLTGNDQQALEQEAANRKKHNLPDNPLMAQLTKILVSVGDDENAEAISQFVKKMPALDANFISREYARICPNIEMSQEMECPSCSDTMEVNIPFNADFFWPK